MSVADVRKEINEAESRRGGQSPEAVLDHVFNARREMARLLEELEKSKLQHKNERVRREQETGHP